MKKSILALIIIITLVSCSKNDENLNEVLSKQEIAELYSDQFKPLSEMPEFVQQYFGDFKLRDPYPQVPLCSGKDYAIYEWQGKWRVYLYAKDGERAFEYELPHRQAAQHYCDEWSKPAITQN